MDVDCLNDKKINAGELWAYCLGEYQSTNPLVKILYRNYFSSLQRIIQTFESNWKLLEVGCGAGESSREINGMLKGQYLEVSELDGRLVNKLLESAPPYRISQESVYALQRIDNEFDVIFLLQVLEHISEVGRALQEIFRVAKRLIVISVPNEPLWRILNILRGKYWLAFGNTPGHINHWTVQQLIQLIKRHGQIISIYNPVPWTIIVAKRHGYH